MVTIAVNASNTSFADGVNAMNAPYDNVSAMNITAELNIYYALPLYGYIMPLLLVVTIVANTLIVMVLSKRHMRTPTNTVLMAMALSDMMTLLFPAPWQFYLYTFGNHGEPMRPLAACYAYRMMIEVIPNLFHTASIWLTLALAVQRYIYVCHPPLARTWCTMERVNKAIIWIYALATLHQLPRFFDQAYESVLVEVNDEPVWSCQHYLADWVNHITADVYYNVYFWFRVTFVHLVPCLSLVVLNVLLFKALSKAQKKREKLFAENKKHQSECRKLRDSNCTTLMLIVVVTVFLVVEIPVTVLTVLHIFESILELHFINYALVNVLILFTNFFISLSYPINFAIYCGMSRQFRETFQDLFIRGNDDPVQSNITESCRYSTVAHDGLRSVNETGV